MCCRMSEAKCLQQPALLYWSVYKRLIDWLNKFIDCINVHDDKDNAIIYNNANNIHKYLLSHNNNIKTIYDILKRLTLVLPYLFILIQTFILL